MEGDELIRHRCVTLLLLLLLPRPHTHTHTHTHAHTHTGKGQVRVKRGGGKADKQNRKQKTENEPDCHSSTVTNCGYNKMLCVNGQSEVLSAGCPNFNFKLKHTWIAPTVPSPPVKSYFGAALALIHTVYESVSHLSWWCPLKLLRLFDEYIFLGGICCDGYTI